MTYLKRFAFHVVMLVVGGGLAILMLNLAGKHMVVPAALSYLMIALFMLIFFLKKYVECEFFDFML